jgi:hypothetical protein
MQHPQNAFQHVPIATTPILIVATPSPQAIRPARPDGSLAQIVATLAAWTTIRCKKRSIMTSMCTDNLRSHTDNLRSHTDNLRSRTDMLCKRYDILQKTQCNLRMSLRMLRGMDRLRGMRCRRRRLHCDLCGP